MEQSFKEIIVLIYLNTYKDSYQYNELKMLLDFNTSQLKEFINIMKEKKLLKESNILILSDKALDRLKRLGLENININDLLQDKCSLKFSEQNKLGFDDIYIPKNFKL